MNKSINLLLIILVLCLAFVFSCAKADEGEAAGKSTDAPVTTAASKPITTVETSVITTPITSLNVTTPVVTTAPVTTTTVVTTTVPTVCNHGFSPWTEIEKPSCDKEGLARRICTLCSHEETKNLEMLPHTEVVDPAVEATCTQNGKTEGKHCSVCKKVTVAQKDIPAAHVFVDGVCKCGEIKPSEGLEFAMTDGGYALVGRGKCTDTFVIIPSQYNGNPVVAIDASAFYYDINLEGVSIPSTVKEISDRAFDECRMLVKVVFEGDSKLEKIGRRAFYSCAFESIRLPDGVTEIGDGAFMSCTALKEFYVPASITSFGKNTFRYTYNIEKIQIGSMKNWCGIGFADKYGTPAHNGASVYDENGELVTKLVIPEGVTAVKRYSFYGFETIEYVSLPSTLRSLENYAFYGCNKIKAFDIKDIAAWCGTSFGNDLGLKGELLCNGVSLATLVIPDGVTKIGSKFGGFTNVTAVIIPDSVTEITDGAFANCQNLKTVTLSKNLLRIGDNAFGSCVSLESVVIPASVNYIGEAAFEKCTGITFFEFECKQGWVVRSESYDRTVYPYMLEGSAQTIKSVADNSYAPWVRV